MTDASVQRDNPSGQIAIPGMGHKKLSPGEAGFRKDGGMQNLMCGNCRYFSEGTCSQVDVSPAPGDYCDEFATPLNDGRTPSGASGPLMVMSEAAHLDLFINRVAEDPQTGIKRWYATSSGVKKDAYGEHMTVALFKDFIRRVETREQPPEMFTSRGWRGGLPYVGVAHYLDLEGEGIVGDAEQLYIDGDVLKAKGIWRETPLAKRAYGSVEKDIADDVPADRRVRISIAFVDWAHDHKGYGTFIRKSLSDACELCAKGLGEKFYKRGHLVHLALTRRPAYAETEIALEERSMTDKRNDAASIVGEDMADELESRAKASLTARSVEEVAPGAVVVRQDAEAKPGGEGGEPAKPEDETDEEKKKREEEEAAKGKAAVVEESVLGGAKSLDEAEAFLVRSGKPPLMDSWAVLGGVLANIAGQDKAPAIAAVVRDFQRTIDQMTVRTLGEVAQFLKAKAEATPVPESTAAPVVNNVAVAIQPHILDEALTAFRSAYDGAMATPVDANNRLSLIQPAMDALGDAVMRNVVDTTASASPSAPSAGATSGISREEAVQLFAENVAPIRAMLEQLIETRAAPVVETRSRIPAPRGLTAALEVPPGAPIVSRSGVLPSPVSRPNSVRAIARRSVGLPD